MGLTGLVSDGSTPAKLPRGPWVELARGWRVLVGSMAGIAIGVISMPVVTLSIFMSGLQHDFGWSRTEVSSAFTVLIAVLLLTSPIVGIICDRVSARIVVLFSHLGLGLAFMAFSKIGGDIKFFLIGFGCMALIGSGASTVAFARIISANFVQARGLALGAGMSGFGITSLVMPLLLAPYVAHHGWRNGFMVLGAAVLVLAPLVYLLLGGTRNSGHRTEIEIPASVEGLAFSDALRSSTFWTMGIAFALISLGISGINVHFVSMMTDVGLSPAKAGAIAGAIGASTIIIRLVTGWLIDRFDAQLVATAMFTAAAACLLLFAAGNLRFALAGAIAYGLAFGSELDIVGYLTARHFGMRAYGRIYGTLYAAILLGSGLSPVLYGLIFQRTGGYHLALQGAAVCIATAAILVFFMPRTSTMRLQVPA